MYGTFGEFVQDEQLGEDDLILTNEYIYEPYMAQYGLKCGICFQEKYGAGEPTDVMIEAIAADVKLSGFKRIIAVGGGTIIDIAKILSLKGFSSVDEVYSGETLIKGKNLVIIPTTCGTGSEVTNFAVVNRTRVGTKMGLGNDALYADCAVLIPEFLRTLPYAVFATSSIDALVHSVESYLHPESNDFTELYAVKAMQMIIASYKQIAEAGPDKVKDLSEELLKASCMAGIAFGNNSCATVHALSYALGGKYHVPHGESNYEFFAEVLKVYKAKAPSGKISKLEKILAESLGCAEEDAIKGLEELLEKILPNKHMREYGAVPEDVEAFADSTVECQQRLLKWSYVPLSRDEIADIYRARL